MSSAADPVADPAADRAAELAARRAEQAEALSAVEAQEALAAQLFAAQMRARARVADAWADEYRGFAEMELAGTRHDRADPGRPGARGCGPAGTGHGPDSPATD